MRRAIALVLLIFVAGFAWSQYNLAKEPPRKEPKDLGLVLNPSPSPYWASEPSSSPQSPSKPQEQSKPARPKTKEALPAKEARTQPASPPPLTLVVDGKTLPQRPMEREGHILVPIEPVLDLMPDRSKNPNSPLGGYTRLDQFQLLYIGYMGHDLDISWGDGAHATVDGKPVELEYPPVEQGFVYVPLSYFDRVLGFEVKYDPASRVVQMRLLKPRPLTLQECDEAYALLDLDALYDTINFMNSQNYYVNREGFNRFLEMLRYYVQAAQGWLTINPMFLVSCREWEKRSWRRYHAASEHPELRQFLERGYGLYVLLGPDRYPQYYTRPDRPDYWIDRPLTPEGCRFALDRLNYARNTHVVHLQSPNATAQDRQWDTLWIQRYDRLISLMNKVCR